MLLAQSPQMRGDVVLLSQVPVLLQVFPPGPLKQLQTIPSCTRAATQGKNLAEGLQGAHGEARSEPWVSHG